LVPTAGWAFFRDLPEGTTETSKLGEGDQGRRRDRRRETYRGTDAVEVWWCPHSCGTKAGAKKNQHFINSLNVSTSAKVHRIFKE
jgi:hypothetical protein